MELLEGTQYRLSHLAPWFHLKQRPSMAVEALLEKRN